MGGAEQGGDTGGERGGGAGAHGLDVGGVAEIEAAEAVGGRRGPSSGEGKPVAAGSADPAADAGVAAFGVAAAGCGESVEGAP